MMEKKMTSSGWNLYLMDGDSPNSGKILHEVAYSDAWNI